MTKLLAPSTIGYLYGPKPGDVSHVAELSEDNDTVEARIDGRTVERVTVRHERGKRTHTRANGQEYADRLSVLRAIAGDHLGKNAAPDTLYRA